MSEPDAPTTKLETVVVNVALEAEHVQRLREAFPDLTITIVEGELRPEAVADADAIVASRFSADVLAAAPRLRWLQTSGAGVDRWPLAELAAREVIVTNASGIHAINMSEHVLAMMLAFARQLPRFARAQQAAHWGDDTIREHLFELSGQTVLVVGLGDVGLGVAARARCLGMHVLGSRRRSDQPQPSEVDEVMPTDRLADALGRADHVVVTVPLTEQTRGLIDAGMIAAMRPGAYLYNVGRGGTIDTDAVISALNDGRLGGAGLDVTDPEPLPADSPLWSMPNVIITAHTSGATPRYWDRGVALVEDNIRRFQAGEPLRNVVDVAAGY